MIYVFFRALFRITNRFYFRQLQVKGLENIPDNGPVMLIANHPSAFMDPMIIGTVTKRPLFFIAKGVLFENKLSAWLLKKINLIPIYRAHETPDKKHLNKGTFQQCYQHFEKNGCLLIFPEGISITERKLRKIQSGTARICLGAEAENSFSLGLKIVPIGLNYSDAHSFQSDLFINIGQPISIADYQEHYEKDSFKAAHVLTDVIRNALEEQMVAIQDDEDELLIGAIEEIYRGQLLQLADQKLTAMQQHFNTSRSIRDSVLYFQKKHPERVVEARRLITEYQKELGFLSLDDRLLDPSQKRSALFGVAGSFMLLILGAPLFFLGFLHNYLPFRIPFWLARFINRRPEFFGSLAYTLGTFTFLIFYSLQVLTFHHFVKDVYWNLLYAAFLPVSGLFAFRYYKRYKIMKSQFLLFSLFYRRQQVIAKLLTRRQVIIDLLEDSRQEFLAQTNTLSTIKP